MTNTLEKRLQDAATAFVHGVSRPDVWHWKCMRVGEYSKKFPDAKIGDTLYSYDEDADVLDIISHVVVYKTSEGYCVVANTHENSDGELFTTVAVATSYYHSRKAELVQDIKEDMKYYDDNLSRIHALIKEAESAS